MVTCIGANYGKTNIAGMTLATNQQINSLVLHDTIEPRFVYYYALSRSFQDQI